MDITQRAKNNKNRNMIGLIQGKQEILDILCRQENPFL